jgi:hypothetical protein
MRDIDGVLYCNDGDWVESRSALVEHMDGTLELIFWNQVVDHKPLLLEARVPQPSPVMQPVASHGLASPLTAKIANTSS